MIGEDDMIISLVIENMVLKLGHEVIGKATSGEEAIEIADEIRAAAEAAKAQSSGSKKR